MVRLRVATVDDKRDFVSLILISAPYFPVLFGKRVKMLLKSMFSSRSNLFSFTHVCVAEYQNRVVGMILSYDWESKRREDLKTGFIMFKKLGFEMFQKIRVFMRFNSTVGKLEKGDYYISNIAVYPEFRGMGIGRKLMLKAEEFAYPSQRLVLDVEKENINAIRFYKDLGFNIINEFEIKLTPDKFLNFYRMEKDLN